MEQSGEKVILILFAVLALSVVVVFALFSFFLPDPELRRPVSLLALRYIYIPVIATTILVGIDAWRRQRSGWWLYVLRRWRQAPRPFLRWQL
jgi:hypothetical protein